MAKKKSVKGSFKALVEKYKDTVLLVLASFLEKEAGHLMTWVKDLAKVRRRARLLVIAIGLVFAGIFLVALGITKCLVFKFPGLSNGTGEILIGIIVIVGAYLIKRLF